MIVLNMRRPFDGARSINVTNNRIRLIMIVPKLEQSSRHSLINSRNGSRFMYQPGQAPPGMLLASVMPRRVATVSVAGVNGWHCSAILLDCRYASPHMIAVTQAA